MKKIIVLGDSAEARYHEVSNLQPLINALSGEYEFLIKEDYSNLKKEFLKEFDICINYIDNWEKNGSVECQDTICAYVAQGGKLLTLHNGIITKSSHPLLLLNGATFTGHEAYGELNYRCTGKYKELQTKVVEFKLSEEPYQYAFTRTEGMEIFLEYQYKGKWYPAGWKIPFEKGMVVYLAPGHDKQALEDYTYVTLVGDVLNFLVKR